MESLKVQCLVETGSFWLRDSLSQGGKVRGKIKVSQNTPAHVYTHILAHTHVHIHTLTHTHTLTRTHAHSHTCTLTHTRIHAHSHTCRHTKLYV